MTQTLDIGIMGQVVYHCAIAIEKYKKGFDIILKYYIIGRKGLSGTSTLTYTITSSGMKKKCFTTMNAGESQGAYH